MATYRTQYRFMFTSSQGYVVEVNIAKKDYAGSIITRALGRAPILRLDNNENVSGSSLEIYAECQSVGEFEHIYTSSADEYKVSLYRNGTKLWEGFITPELYSEPDLPAPYDVRIIATDGLGELKRSNYDLKGTYTLREHLTYILAKTNIERDILLALRLNVVATDYGYTADKLLDTVTLSLDHEIGETCYDVLQHVMTSLNAGITMYNNRWYIYRETDFLKTVSDGAVKAYMGSAVVSLPIVQFGSMTTNKWWPIGNMTMANIPAKKSIQLTAPYNYHENLLTDSAWAKATNSYYDETKGAFALPNAGSSITQKVTFSPNDFVRDRLVLKMKARNTGVGTSEAPVNIRIQMYGRKGTAVSTYYLTGTIPTSSRPNTAPYAWSTTQGDLEYSLNAPAESDTHNDAQEIEVVIPLYSGSRAYAYAYDITVAISNASGTYGVYLYDVSLSQYDRAEGIITTVNINNNAREKASDVDLYMADASQLNVGARWLMSGVPITPTGQYIVGWYGGPLTRSEPYITWMAADYAAKLGTVRKQYTGRLHVGDSNIPALFSRDGVYYFPKSYSYDLYEDEMEVDLISIPDNNVEVE